MASSRFFVCWVPFCRTTVAVVFLGLWSGSAFAKTAELSAIEVYPTGDARAYVQISGFTLNAKNEVHVCTGVQSINKNSYGKLPKLTLAPGMTLDRGKDGVLLLTRGGAPECVVPAGLKLEKAEGATPSELADQVDLQGQIVAKSISSTQAIPRIVPGVKIVLVATLGYGIGRIPARPEHWPVFPVGRLTWVNILPVPTPAMRKLPWPCSTCRTDKPTWRAYQASLKSGQPNYEKLQAAKISLEAAKANASSNDVTDALAKAINGETGNLNSKGLEEVALYRDALAKQTSGYSHLVAASAISQQTLILDPKSAETAKLSQACIQEKTNIDHHLVDFANFLSARRPDQAYEAIKPLRPFAGEYPKVQESLHSLYSYYVSRGRTTPQRAIRRARWISFKRQRM